MKLGIDLGGSHISVGIISEKLKIVAKREKDIENIFKIENIEERKEYIINTIKNLISEVLKDVGAPSCVISQIGISTPGKVRKNVIYEMYNLGIKEFNLPEELEKYYGAEVKARNDAKCAALAEKEIGSLKQYDDCIFLCLGTGIGGATFLEGKLLEYHKEEGSEYGHMIIQKGGRECKCGNKGCFEKYASMKAFKEGFIQLLDLREDITSEMLLQILKENVEENDKKVNEYIDEYIDYLLTGISNIVNIIRPEAICIGGSFVHYREILYMRLIEKIKENKYNAHMPIIILAELKNDAGVIGSQIAIQNYKKFAIV